MEREEQASIVLAACERERSAEHATADEIRALEQQIDRLREKQLRHEHHKLRLWKLLGEVTGNPLWLPHPHMRDPEQDAEALAFFARIDEHIARTHTDTPAAYRERARGASWRREGKARDALPVTNPNLLAGWDQEDGICRGLPSHRARGKLREVRRDGEWRLVENESIGVGEVFRMWLMGGDVLTGRKLGPKSYEEVFGEVP